MISTRTPNILQFGWRMDWRPLKQNYNESLVVSLLEILCFSYVLRVLRVFFIFEGFVVEVPRGFWGLIPVELLYFWVLLNFLWCCLYLDVLVYRNALGRLLFKGVWRWMNDMWWSLIGDMCCLLIGGALRLFLQDMWHLLIGWKSIDFQGDTCQNLIGLLMSLLTRARLLTSLLTPANVWLAFCMLFMFLFHGTRRISIGFWIMIVEPSCCTWHFVIWPYFVDLVVCCVSLW